MSTCKILLVDDDEEDKGVIIDALKELDAGDITCCAENGEAALQLLSEKAAAGAYPSLIVLDLNMPKMNGTQTLKNLKADDRFRDIAVLIYSTSVNPLEKETCMTLGALSYITKPVTYKESLDTAKLFLSLCETKF